MSEEIYLYPEEFSTDNAYNTRLWPNSPIDLIAESRLVDDLASNIESHGQFDAIVCVVDPARPLPHVLVTGHRRRKAIAQINFGRKESDRQLPLMKLRARIDSTGRDMFQYAALSNFQNQSLSLMDKATIIHRLRKQYRDQGLDYNSSFAAIAKYLDIDVSSAKSIELLLTRSDPATRAALHSGLISRQTAEELLKALDSKRQAVLDLAAKIEATRPLNKKEFLRLRAEDRNAINMRVNRITRASVIRAVHELSAKGAKPSARTRTDLLHWLAGLDDLRRGCHNADIRVWARTLLGWLKGLESDEAMHDAFEAMAKLSSRGRHSALDDFEAEQAKRRVRLDQVKALKANLRTNYNPRGKTRKFNPNVRSKTYKDAEDSVITI